MMRKTTVWSLLLLGVLAGCGAAPEQAAAPAAPVSGDEVRLSAADVAPRTVLSRGELTSAVDLKRYRATDPPATAFPAGTKEIFFVGRLKDVPTDATIEIRWFATNEPSPLLVAAVQGSESYEFVASFQPTPPDKTFRTGSYVARVYVDDAEVGARSFTVGNPDAEAGPRVARLLVSESVNAAMEPKRPKTAFDTGTRTIHVSFDVTGSRPDEVVDVEWLRDGESFHTEEVRLSGDRRYAASIQAAHGLPNGAFGVEVSVGHEVVSSERFRVGPEVEGPSVEIAGLGLVLDEGSAPKKAMTAFPRDTRVIQCGMRFYNLAPGSIIEVRWTKVDPDGDSVLFVNRSQVPGGSGTMGAAFEPTRELEPGAYKAAVAVGGAVLAEEPFTVE